MPNFIDLRNPQTFFIPFLSDKPGFVPGFKRRRALLELPAACLPAVPFFRLYQKEAINAPYCK